MKSLRLVFLFAPTLLAAQTAPLSDVQKEFFETSIRPVLSESCGACHGDSKMGGLRVLSKDDLLKGGASGPAVVPGAPRKLPPRVRLDPIIGYPFRAGRASTPGGERHG